MADFLTNVVFRYTGTPPGTSLTFAQTTLINSGLTFTDNDGLSNAFEPTDAITEPFTFNGPYTYSGTADWPRQGGGTITVPILTDGTETLVVLPGGIAANQVVIQSSFDASGLGNTSSFPVCFAPGTEIATPDGPALVETLKIGDRVLRADGRATDVLWIGRQTVLKATAGEAMQPVRFRAGSLGDGLPRKDLTVTADHGMVFFPPNSDATGDTRKA
ncbi:MAG: Hint domain-containing protein, partial [Pseudomonadota bacterium]